MNNANAGLKPHRAGAVNHLFYIIAAVRVCIPECVYLYRKYNNWFNDFAR